jgi:Bacterial EndoU nuclease
MAAGFAVRIDDLHTAAGEFTQLRRDAERLLAAGALGGSGGMAGRDPVLAAWRARYDAMAAAQWAASTAAVATLGAIATKLAGTADTYVAAEHTAAARVDRPPHGVSGQEDGRRTGAPAAGARAPGADGRSPPQSAGTFGASGHPSSREDPAGGAGEPRSAAEAGGGPAPGADEGPPPSTGPGGPDVPDATAAYYPGGDPERLRAAAAHWAMLAEGMNRIAGNGDAVFRRLVDTGDGVAFRAMQTFWARRFTPCATDPLFNAVVNGAGVLRDSCRELAELIEHTRAAVRGAAAEAVADMEPLKLPARLFGKLAWNIPELELLVGMGALAVAYLNDYRDNYLFALDRLVERLRPDDEQRLRRVAMLSPPVGSGLTDAGSVAELPQTGAAWDTAMGPHPMPDAIHVTPDQVAHILVGDQSGGGHAPGTGRAGQSEFPTGWGTERILAATLDVARAPETLRRGRHGRWVAEGVQDGVRIRVVVGPDGFIITSIPLSGPGVVRNAGMR